MGGGNRQEARGRADQSERDDQRDQVQRSCVVRDEELGAAADDIVKRLRHRHRPEAGNMQRIDEYPPAVSRFSAHHRSDIGPGIALRCRDPASRSAMTRWHHTLASRFGRQW